MLPHFTWSYTTTTHKPTSLISLFSLPHPLSRLNPKTLPSLHHFLSFSFISSFWRPRLSLSKLASSLEVRNFCCMLIWSRNGALILMDLESPFWRFLNDDLDVFLVRFHTSFWPIHTWIITFGNDSNEEPNVYIYICEMMILKFMIWGGLLVYSKGVMLW